MPLVFARGRSLFAAGFDSRAIRLTGEPRAMGVDVQTTLLQAGPMYAVARNGTLVYPASAGPAVSSGSIVTGVKKFVNADERMYCAVPAVARRDARGRDLLLDGTGLWVIGLDGSLRGI